MFGKYCDAVWSTWEGKMSGIASLLLTLIATYSTFFTGEAGLARAKIYLWFTAGCMFGFAN